MDRNGSSTMQDISTPKTYPSRSGTSDSGKEYELKIATLLMLRTFGQTNTKNAWLAMNVDECGAFDDIVLYRERNDGTKAVYLIQLKHEDKGSNIEAKEFKSKKKTGPFSVQKYISSIQDISRSFDEHDRSEMIDYLSHHRKDMVFALFTNRGTTTECDFLNKVAEGSDLDTNFMLYETLNTRGNVFLFDHEIVSGNLFLFANQENVNTVNKTLGNALKDFIQPVRVSDETLSDIMLQLLHFITEWSKGILGGYYPITRSHLLRKTTELLLTPYMKPLDPPLDNEYFEESAWNDIINNQDIIVIDKADDNVVEYVIKTTNNAIINYDNPEQQAWWKAKMDVVIQDLLMVVNKSKMTHLEAYQHLWKTRKVPLLLEINSGNDELMNILKFSQGIFRALIFNQTEHVLETICPLKVFSNFNDLAKNHQEMILHHSATLQGRLPLIQIKDLINKENLKHIRTRDIIDILMGKFTIGKTYGDLPEFFQEVSVTRIWLDVSVLQKVQGEVFAIKCGNSTALNVLLRASVTLSSICSWKNIQERCEADVITYENDDNVGEIGQYCASRKAIHFLAFHDGGLLEWTKSIGSVREIKPFRMFPDQDLKPCALQELPKSLVSTKRPVIISSNPGTGKSVLLNYVAKSIPSNFWVLKINLMEHSDAYKKWNSKQSFELFYKIIEKVLAQEGHNHDLVQAMFHQHLDSKNLVLLLDGFDEIPMACQKGAKEMVSFLSSLGYYICITTRPVLKIELESLLDTFAIAPNLFTKSNQENFLHNYFSKTSDASFSEERMQNFVEKLLELAKENLKDHGNNIVGVPLHITLLAEAFLADCRDYLTFGTFQNKHFDLLFLYQYFIDKKIHIASVDEDMIAQHKVCRSLYALRLIFPESDLQPLGVNEKLKLANKMFPLMWQLVQKDGVVVAEDQSSVTFVHRTFAEYLTAQWMAENMSGKYSDVVKRLLSESFHPTHEMVRNIFDRILASGCLLHLAVINRQEKEARRLIRDTSSIVEQRDEGGRIALHLIASWGLYHPPAADDDAILNAESDDVSKILPMISPEEIIRSDKDSLLGYTPLDYAIASGSLNVANVICANLRNPYRFKSLKDLNKTYPLSYIIKMNYVALASTLFKFYFSDNFRPFILKPAANGSSIEMENKEAILSLISDSKNIDKVVDMIFCQQEDNTAAELAISELTSKRDSVLDLDYAGKSFLLESSFFSKRNILEPYSSNVKFIGSSLLRKNFKYKGASRETKGKSILLAASIMGNADIIESLLSNGFTTEAKCNDGTTALIIATFMGHTEVVKLLLSHGADMEAKGPKGNTALITAALMGRIEIAELLLSCGADPEAKDINGGNALISASTTGHADVVNLLLLHGCNKETKNKDGNTALIAAAVTGKTEVIKVLLSHKVSSKTKNCNGYTALIAAASTANVENIELLISHGSDVEAKTTDGMNAMGIAALIGHTDTINLLLNSGADIEARDNAGNTPLISSAFMGRTSIVRLLLSHGSVIEAKNNVGNTALIVAAHKGHLEMLTILLDHGANKDARNNCGDTALTLAALSGQPGTVNVLLAHGVDKNIKSSDGNSALTIAAYMGHLPLVKQLLNHGVDMEAKNNVGNTALILSTIKGHVEVVKLLLLHGSHVESTNSNGDTALIVAARMGHSDIVNLLLDHGSNKEAKNIHGDNALITSAYLGHTNIAMLLISRSCDVNAAVSNGNTALSLAAVKGNSDIVTLLLKHGADCEARNSNGDTALILAACTGQTNTMKLLLSHGCDVDAKNNNNSTALIWASRNKHVDIVSLLLLHGADISIKDNGDLTAFDWAKKNRFMDVVDLIETNKRSFCNWL